MVCLKFAESVFVNEEIGHLWGVICNEENGEAVEKCGDFDVIVHVIIPYIPALHFKL